MMILIIFCTEAFLIFYLLNELRNETEKTEMLKKKVKNLQSICKDSYKRGFCDAVVQAEENRKNEEQS